MTLFLVDTLTPTSWASWEKMRTPKDLFGPSRGRHNSATVAVMYAALFKNRITSGKIARLSSLNPNFWANWAKNVWWWSVSQCVRRFSKTANSSKFKKFQLNLSKFKKIRNFSQPLRGNFSWRWNFIALRIWVYFLHFYEYQCPPLVPCVPIVPHYPIGVKLSVQWALFMPEKGLKMLKTDEKLSI